MHVLSGERWVGGLLDYHRQPGELTIEPESWVTVAAVDGLYFEPAHDWVRLANYVREVGFGPVARKVRSRRSEGLRNQKYLSVGAGRVSAADDDALASVGDSVLFVACCHPRCTDRLTVPELLTRSSPSIAETAQKRRYINYLDLNLRVIPPPLNLVSGFSPLSGADLPSNMCSGALAAAEDLLKTHRSSMEPLPLPQASPVETIDRAAMESSPPRSNGAAIVGYGHYAKTIIEPNVRAAGLDVSRVYELDPTQLAGETTDKLSCTTASSLLQSEDYDIVFVAGYHHTHAKVAVQAIERGAAVAIEKPIVTTYGQLEAMRTALQEAPDARAYACFHKRHSYFNQFIRRDLDLASNEPLHYYCIVYEVPLPARHWYRWPNSQSRIVSNGCHWIDHFLYLNDFAAVRQAHATRMANGDVSCSLELDNGASFNMLLTDEGSPRIGVQDHVEIRANGATIRIRNARRYSVERSGRVRRRRTQAKMASYETMYQQIVRRVSLGQGGEEERSLLASSEAMLKLEDLLTESVIDLGDRGTTGPANLWPVATASGGQPTP